jgi:fermentation-respiration switch protein FrsA (DUF1100 family)
MTLLLKSLVIVAAIYALVVLSTYYLQSALLYFPDTNRVTPQSVGLTEVVERELVTADGERVIAWHGAARPGQPTILYFHGNGGSLGARSERIRKYLARGYGVFMMTYRGYGGSTGRPSERANVADAKLAYDTLVALGVGADRIILYGESVGSGIAVQVAAEKHSAGLILDAPYTSIVDVAELHYPYLPARWLMTDRYETVRYMDRVTVPLLVIHGEADDVIPVEMGRAVYATARGPKELITLPGAGHSDHHLFGSYDVIYRWIEALRPRRLDRVAE